MALLTVHPWAGVAIPCMLIGGLAYPAHYFVFRHELSSGLQIAFEACITMTWVSYYLAIVTPPGSPPPGFEPSAGEWRRWCKKCANYKPERSHHCKTCGVCVLKMDHHCPWTYNCVGHGNMGEFARFVVWVLVATGSSLWVLGAKLVDFYRDRHLPSYLVRKSELVATIVITPLAAFVFLSILILYGRCIANWGFKGMTQIEVWELERIESQFHSERMWVQIRRNYARLHGKPMPELTSWNRPARYYEAHDEPPARRESEVPPNFTVDDLVFPYDLGLWQNLVQTFNQPWLWLWPLAKAPRDGLHFPKNEFAEDDQLGLPWPPDGGHNEMVADPEIEDLDAIELRNLRTLRKRLDPRAKLGRREWTNDLGESLDDFGVDLDAEDSEHDDLLALRNG